MGVLNPGLLKQEGLKASGIERLGHRNRASCEAHRHCRSGRRTQPPVRAHPAMDQALNIQTSL
jgi:hypothetical protein